MKYASLILSGCVLCLSIGCSAQTKKKPATKTSASAGFIKNPNGLEYKIVKKGTGTVTPNVGDFGEMNLKFKIGDSVLINTYEMNMNKPIVQQIQKGSIKGDVMEGLMTMKAGDSVIFRMLMDTLATRANQPKPEWAKPGDYAIWEVKMINVKTKQQMEAESANKEKVQSQTDDKLIQDFLKGKGITNAKKTASGLYYVVHTEGKGPMPAAGQKVTVNYTGQNLKGEKFDSNVDPAFSHVEPFSFDLGKRSVIKGWDEGVALMNKGTKATFYLPSHLAYGDRGAGAKIPANAILIFDIELLDFK
jgi:FKBP-type peptidyl-prolyl cis-trans isomerase FkpA